MEAFGGTDPVELAQVVRHGFATWVETDAADARVVTAHGAALARVPLETAHETVTDFERVHEFLPVARPSQIISRAGETIVVKLRQGVGLGVLSLGLEETFRFRLHPPTGFVCEEYLGGDFDHAIYELRLYPIGEDETLITLSFLVDIGALGRIPKLFFRHQPEVEFAASANMLLVPVLGFVREAERRAGRVLPERRPPEPLWEALAEGKLAPAVRRGYLTVGRLDPGGRILDIASATRLGASRERVWEVARNPARLGDVLSMVSGGGIEEGLDPVKSTLHYRVRIGPFSKRYAFERRVRATSLERIEAIAATINGHPAEQADYLFDRGAGTLYCIRYYTDVKVDWFSRIFLRSHPEFESVISTYPAIILSRGFRKLFGPPRDDPDT